MVGLAGEIGGNVVVLVFFESAVAQIAPEDGGHAEFVSFGKRATDFLDLPIGLVGAEINGGADGGGAHIPGFAYGAESDLVKFIGKSEQLVVIDFDDERNFMRVLARNGAKHAES